MGFIKMWFKQQRKKNGKVWPNKYKITALLTKKYRSLRLIA